MMEHFLQSVVVVIPIIFVLAFGFFAGKTNQFNGNDKAIPIINELVLNFALPCSLFVGTISISRVQLIDDLVLFFSLLITLLIAYLFSLFLAKFVFKRNIVESSIAGLAVSFSAGPFYGPALLGSLYGVSSGVAISMISVVINVFIVPLATIIIKVDLLKSNTTANKPEVSIYKMVGRAIYQAIFKTPFVWAPLLAFILVFLNIKTPSVMNNSLELIGKATAGIAVFVAGMTIAVNKFKLTGEVLLISLLKSIGLPVLFFIVALALHMAKGTPIFNQGLLLAALPSGPMIVLLATKYKQYQEEASSILAITTLGMIITVTALIMII